MLYFIICANCYSHEPVERVPRRVISGFEAAIGELHQVVLAQVDGRRTQLAVLDTPQAHVVTTARDHAVNTYMYDLLNVLRRVYYTIVFIWNRCCMLIL